MVSDNTRGVVPVDAQGPARDLLRAYIRGAWTRMRTPGFHAMYRLIMGELLQFPDLTRFYADEIAGTTMGHVAALVERGVASGEFRAIDPMAAGRLLAALLTQNAMWAGRPELFPHTATRSDDEVLAEIEAFFFRVLVP